MATRLLSAAAVAGLCCLSVTAGAEPWYADQAGLYPPVDETTKDAIREQVIEAYFQAPHAVKREPDVQRMRDRMSLPNRTDRPAMSGGLDSAQVQMFFADNTPLGVVMDTLAYSLGYDANFVEPWLRGQLIPEAIRGEHEVAELVAWLTERMGIPITIYPESRLVMINRPRGAR